MVSVRGVFQKWHIFVVVVVPLQFTFSDLIRCVEDVYLARLLIPRPTVASR